MKNRCNSPMLATLIKNIKKVEHPGEAICADWGFF